MINIKGNWPFYLIVIVTLLVVVSVASNGWPIVITENSFNNEFFKEFFGGVCTLITGLAAVLAAYITVNKTRQMHDDIRKEEIKEKLQIEFSKALALLHLLNKLKEVYNVERNDLHSLRLMLRHSIRVPDFINEFDSLFYHRIGVGHRLDMIKKTWGVYQNTARTVEGQSNESLSSNLPRACEEQMEQHINRQQTLESLIEMLTVYSKKIGMQLDSSL